MWTDRPKCRYLGVQFLCGDAIEVDVPVKRQFYAACNSSLARSSGTCDPVEVQLVKSYLTFTFTSVLYWCFTLETIHCTTLICLLERCLSKKCFIISVLSQ